VSGLKVKLKLISRGIIGLGGNTSNNGSAGNWRSNPKIIGFEGNAGKVTLLVPVALYSFLVMLPTPDT
jgi:hypothetical protein